ncbi:MAG TPA: glycerol-3-phosphate 1-O-acyltransferase PlsY [Terriglobales bacterium]|nr:glycerol-3-phosphate 1-O-acyltransferase PlsY [Terriglobales bacterium]
MIQLALIFTAYLLGSISFAVVVSRVLGLPDPHTYGSGNPGATNVLRTGNKVAAALTLAGDALKGAVALALSQRLAPALALTDLALAAVPLVVFLGHLYPVFFRFKGGKGVATAAGIVFVADWRLGLALVATWLVVAAAFRYSSLAAIAAACVAPFGAAALFGVSWMTGSLTLIALLLVWRHRSNIRKLNDGTETRIRLSREAKQAPSGDAR